MKTALTLAGLVGAITVLACGGVANQTALSTVPHRTLVQFACIDANGDPRINAVDVTGDHQPPDFDGDGKRDANDAAFFPGRRYRVRSRPAEDLLRHRW